MDSQKTSIQFTLKNLSGEEKRYFLFPLKRKTASLVAHLFLQTILKGMSQALKDTDSENTYSNVLKALSEIDFDVLWGMAIHLFKNATIKSKSETIEIESLDESDYFSENPDELYIAVYHGVKENYPKVFSRVRELTKGLNLGQFPDKIISENQDTVSNDGK